MRGHRGARARGRVRASAALPLAALALAAAGCAPEPKVSRVYDGKVVEERFIPPDAYAAFLRGALAEAAGDHRGAITAYTQAAEEDDDPEIFTRLAEVRCTLDPKDPDTDKLFARALKLDPNAASTLAAQSRCLGRRGRVEEAAALAGKAAAVDPKNVGLESLYLRSAAHVKSSPNDAQDRQRALALTASHASHEAAWDALVVWGRSRRDAELVAAGFIGLVRTAPARSAEVERGAALLLEEGQAALARKVAVAVADAPRELDVRGPRDATVARLAVDDALARGDREAALARATRGRVPVAEVAARALLLDKKDLANALAKEVTDADPSASGGQMLRAVLRAGASASPAAAKALAAAVTKTTDQPPELCALVFADKLAVLGGADAAREWLAKVTRTPMAAHDPLGAPLAGELVKRGVLPSPDAVPEKPASL